MSGRTTTRLWLQNRFGAKPGVITLSGHYRRGRVAHAEISVSTSESSFNNDFNNDFGHLPVNEATKSTYFPVKGDWLNQEVRKEVDGKIGEEFSTREGIFNMRRYK